jgi:hypothetical protein
MNNTVIIVIILVITFILFTNYKKEAFVAGAENINPNSIYLTNRVLPVLPENQIAALTRGETVTITDPTLGFNPVIVSLSPGQSVQMQNPLGGAPRVITRPVLGSRPLRGNYGPGVMAEETNVSRYPVGSDQVALPRGGFGQVYSP